MAIRNIGGLDWEAQTPSEYKLKDNDNIVAVFTGKDWRFKDSPVVGFRNMKSISIVVKAAIDEYSI